MPRTGTSLSFDISMFSEYWRMAYIQGIRDCLRRQGLRFDDITKGDYFIVTNIHYSLDDEV